MSRGHTREKVIKTYLNIPKALRSIPDKLIKNRNKIRKHFDRHSKRGENALNNMVNSLTKKKKRRRKR